MEDSLIEQGFEIVNADDAIPDKAIKSIKSDDAQVQQPKCENSGGDDDEEEEEDQEYLIGQSSFAIVDHIPQSDDAEPTTTKNKEAEQGSSVSNPGAKETGTETETVGKASEKEEEKEQPQSSTSPKPRKAKAIVEIVSEGAVSSTKSTKSTTSANKVQAKAKDSSSNSVKKLSKPALALPPQEQPVHSAVVIAVAFIGYILATIDFGTALPFLILRLLNAVLVVTFGLTIGEIIHEKYVLKSLNPVSTNANDVFRPIVELLSTEFNKIVVMDNRVVRALKAFFSYYVHALYCTHYAATVQMILMLHFGSKLVYYLSFASIFMTATILFFTVPYIYEKHQTNIDAKLAKLQEIHVSVVDMMAQLILPAIGHTCATSGSQK